jgi:hypothetical protein
MNTWTSVCRGLRSLNIYLESRSQLCLPANFQVSLLKIRQRQSQTGEKYLLCLHNTKSSISSAHTFNVTRVRVVERRAGGAVR